MNPSGSLTDPVFLESVGGWLSFGTIGLGLALALISAIVLTFRPNPRLYMVATLLSAFIIAFGGGIEFFRAVQKARLDQASLNLSTYFGSGAWADLAEAISLKFSGSKEVTGNALSKLLKKDQEYPYPVTVPGGQCRYVIAIAQPPSDIVMARPANEKLEVDVDDRSFYKWITICNKSPAPEAWQYPVKVVNSDGMVRVSTYRDKGEPAATANASSMPRIIITACLGEYLGNCPEKSDVFYGCGSAWGDGVAVQECRKRGYPDGKSAFHQRVSVGGNKCGYAIADVTCG